MAIQGLPFEGGSGPLKRRTELFQRGFAIAGHTLIKLIGLGSYGEVWLAQNQLTSVYRAIKIVSRDFFDEDRPYQREFEAIQSFEPISRSHPGLVPILQVGKLENAFYYIMELADDERAGQQIDPATYKPFVLSREARKRFSTTELVNLSIALCDAIAFLHQRQLIHRDIKPGNVVFIEGTPRLADIGLVTQLSKATSYVGTSGFIPPEGPTTFQADVYGFGKMLYEVVTGRDRLEFAYLPDSITSGRTELMEINPIILKACESNPAHRYKTIAEVRFELDLLRGGKSVLKYHQMQRRLRAVLWGALAMALLGGIGFGAYDQKQRAEKRAAEDRQRKIGVLIGKGADKLQEGDYMAALAYFVPAALQDDTHRATHELRLGSVLSRTVIPVSEWLSPEGAIAISSDGESLAVASPGKTTLHDSLTGKILREFPLSGDAIAISTDKTKIVLAVVTNVTEIAISSGEARKWTIPKKAASLSYRPDGETLAVNCGGEILILRQGQAQTTFKTAALTFRTFWNPTGSLLAAAEFNGKVELWEYPSGRKLPFMPAHNNFVYGVWFSEDGQRVTSFGLDRLAITWNLTSGVQTRQQLKHRDGITTMAFDNSLNLLATSSLDGLVKIWDAVTQSPVAENHKLYHPSRAEYCFFHPNDSLLTRASDRVVRVWNLQTPALAHATRPRVFSLEKLRVQTPTSSLEVTNQTILGTVQSRPVRIDLAAPIASIALSSSESLLAVGTWDPGFNPHAVTLYNSKGEPTGIRLQHRDGINHVVFDRAGQRVVSCSEDWSCIIWDAATGAQLTRPMLHSHQARWAAFSPDEEWLATVSWDGKVTLWDSATGDQLTPSFKLQEKLEAVQFLGAGHQVLVAGPSDENTFDLPLYRGDFKALLSRIPGHIELSQHLQ